LPSYAEPIAQHIFTFGAYESETRDYILRFLPQEGVFVDVGANIGALAIPIANARPRASILCIEADPNIYSLLQRNVARNGCTGIRTVSCVAGANDGELIPFYLAPDEKFGMGSVGPQFGVAPLMLKQRRLDCLLDDYGMHRIDVVKIDVEGFELDVLRGGERLLGSPQPPVIVFEFADWAEARIVGQTPGGAQDLLLNYGYRLFHLEPNGCHGKELRVALREGTAMLGAVPPSISL
jgi:FkbM family methyltransferase